MCYIDGQKNKYSVFTPDFNLFQFIANEKVRMLWT
jgi:hypothetical protein